jgi:flagellar basal-body rod protein FlgG
MVKGFYNLTSAMLTHGRHLDVISNNMSNAATVGFKSDRFTGSTFENVMWQLVGNKTKTYQDIGEQSWISAPSQLYTDFTQGSFDNTVLPLDFAINGPGYFAIQTGTEETGENPQFGDWPGVRRGIVYTRAGSFSLDNEGYLTLPNQGRVLSQTLEPIRLVTDKFTTDGYGGLFTTTGGFLGRIGVFTFEDEEAMLEKDDYGMFTAQEEGQAAPTPVLNGWVERANIDWVKEMTEMISTQRTYQSAAEALKIYDGVLNRVTQEVGRLS